MSNEIKQHGIGILFSGGVDSAALIQYFLDRNFLVFPVYVQCGLPWEKTEIRWAQKFLSSIKSNNLKQLKILKLSLDNAYHANWSQTGKTPGPESHDSSVFLPARNLLLIIKGLLYLASINIYNLALGTLKNNPFSDARKDYFKSLEKILSRSFGNKINLYTPFRNKTKISLIKKFSALPFHLSFSCIAPKNHRHCGKCNKCIERKRAFEAAVFFDKTNYALG